MNEQLAAAKEGRDEAEVAGEYGSKPLYRTLGYFSIIGLLRVHCLLGDFTLALKMMDNIELNKKVSIRYHRPLIAGNVRPRLFMPLPNLLLRRLRLHDAPPLLRCNQSLCQHPPLHLPHKTTPTPLLSV